MKSMMQLSIRYWSGKHELAALLAQCGTAMRVAVRGSGDATEFRFRGGQWFAEDGNLVEIALHPSFREEYSLGGPCGDAPSIPALGDLGGWLN
jgi:hypothetical protein